MNDHYQHNLETVSGLIESAAKRSERNIRDITLMAVSKTHPIESILKLAECGQTLFGENRVQEIEQKFSKKFQHIKLHMIGHLQSNKVKKAVALVDAIDSVDSLALARRIGQESVKIGKIMPILIEYNTSNESSKAGFNNELEYFSFLDQVGSIDGVRVGGLMTVGPLGGDESALRKAFSYLRELRERSRTAHPELDFNILSMGMSQDFSIAIEEGSTLVRIGTALFGARNQ
ncbi:MAG: YggS family pyridoxal phosphate-dependent enzyme [Sphaerochaetaceae bacterium]|jgi:pyridoxal phosphate enzyme (YggS family)|nr:YggS family pyridoxal phosphate-dependent enzyme [Sphaerochaetaceae bacterium]